MIKNISSQLKNNKMIGAEPMLQKLKILIMKNSIFLKIMIIYYI